MDNVWKNSDDMLGNGKCPKRSAASNTEIQQNEETWLDTENGLLLGNDGYKVNMTVSSLVISLKNPVPEIVLHGQEQN